MIKELYKKYVSEKNILIYQMGKVGSSSLTESLKELNILGLNIHSFFMPIPNSLFKKYKSIKYYWPKTKLLFYCCFFRMQFYLLKQRKKLKIITLTREPISRNISFYFQDFQIPIMEVMKDNPESSKNGNIKLLFKDFFQNFNHCHGVNWFDKEFKRAFNINVYKYPFDKDKGYTIIKERNLEILVIKVEKLNELEAVVGEFIGRPEFRLINENEGYKKWYSCLQNNFVNSIEFSEEYVESLYDTKYMHHFYTDTEIARFRKKYLTGEKISK